MNMCGPGSSVGFSPKLLLTTAYQPLISATFSLCDFYWCVVQEARLSLHLTGVQIVLENSANISLHYPPTTSPCFPLLVSFSLLFPSVEKVKSRPIGIRVSISVFAGLCNRKRQAAGWALRQQITVWKREVAVGMGGGFPCGLAIATMWLWELGWSQHWQSEGSDGWTKQGTGCENGWGQRGNLTQTNRMKDREELPAQVCPPLAPRAICLLLSEHPKMLCIFADFPASFGRGRLVDSSSHEPDFVFPFLPGPQPLFMSFKWKSWWIYSKFMAFLQSTFSSAHSINVFAKFPFIS